MAVETDFNHRSQVRRPAKELRYTVESKSSDNQQIGVAQKGDSGVYGYRRVGVTEAITDVVELVAELPTDVCRPSQRRRLEKPKTTVVYLEQTAPLFMRSRRSDRNTLRYARRIANHNRPHRVKDAVVEGIEILGHVQEPTVAIRLSSPTLDADTAATLEALAKLTDFEITAIEPELHHLSILKATSRVNAELVAGQLEQLDLGPFTMGRLQHELGQISY